MVFPFLFPTPTFILSQSILHPTISHTTKDSTIILKETQAFKSVA